MFSCKQISQIVSESLDRKLPFWTRMELRMHLAMCGVCYRFSKNMKRVDREIKRRAQEIDSDSGNGAMESPRLPENTCNRIKRELAGNK